MLWNQDTRNKISILLQKPYLFNKNSYENVISGLKFRKFKNEEINMRVEKYSKYFNIEPLLEKKSHWLSGGEKAKIALLRTAVLETDLIMLDEPTASMDIESSLVAEKLIKDLAKGDRTVIVISHDINSAKRVADYIVYLDKGKVLEMGQANTVLNNPSSSILKKILNI